MWLYAAAPQQHGNKCWHRLESVQKSKLSFSVRTHLFPVPSFCWSQEDWCIRTWRQPLQSPAGASQTSSPTLMHWMALWKKERKSREQRSCSCLANTALFIAYPSLFLIICTLFVFPWTEGINRSQIPYAHTHTEERTPCPSRPF